MKYFFIILFFFFISIIYSQQQDTTQTDQALEDLLEDATTDLEDSQIFDTIEYLLENPILLNTASIKDLLKIPLVNVQIATAIIRYRNLQGGIYTIEQLQNVPGIENELIQKIIPFLKLGDESDTSFFKTLASNFENIHLTYRFRVQQDLQTRNGFLSGKYLGTKPKYYNRFKIKTSDNFEAGLLMEKDSGEKSISDFSSFFIRLRHISFIQSAILGDFVFEFGQGIALWSPYSFSKGTDATDFVIRNGANAIPYSSADENKFMRGVALKIPIDKITFSPFFSRKSIDASIDSFSNHITSLVVDGFHRTTSEINKQNSVNEEIFGSSMEYELNETSKFGLLYFRTKYSNEFKDSTFLKPEGSHFEYFSGSYSTLIDKIFLSGEIAYNKKSISSIHAAQFLINKDISLVFSLRNFPRNYINLHANSFGENGSAQNEVGFYSGLSINTAFGKFNLYYDQFKSPVASSKYNFSSHGDDLLIYYTNKIFTNTEIKFKYKIETKNYVESVGEFITLEKQSLQNFRIELAYKTAKNIHLRSRIELTYFSNKTKSKENGYLIFQDMKYSPITNLNLYVRFIFFRTDSYDSRIYEFENDHIGVMYNPALYGEGIRWYCIARYKTNFGLSFSLKYSELTKVREKSLGSGDSQINSNLDNKISLQIDFNF